MGYIHPAKNFNVKSSGSGDMRPRRKGQSDMR